MSYYFRQLVFDIESGRFTPGTPTGSTPVTPTPPTAASTQLEALEQLGLVIDVLALSTPGTRPLSHTPLIMAAASHGTAVPGTDGTITYTSAVYTGPDHFDYRVEDVAGLDSNTARIDLSVIAPVSPPPPPPPPPPVAQGTTIYEVGVYAAADTVYEEQVFSAPATNTGFFDLVESSSDLLTITEGGDFLRLVETPSTFVDESGNTFVATPGGDVLVTQ